MSASEFFAQCLVVSDPAWMPQADTALRVDALLRRWKLLQTGANLLDNSPEHFAWRHDRGLWLPHSRGPVQAELPGPGLLYHYEYPHWEGALDISTLGEGSDEEEGDDPPNLDHILLIVGTYFRIQDSGEIGSFNVEQPPRQNGRDLEPAREEDKPIGDEFQGFCHGDVYAADAATEPPIVRYKSYETFSSWFAYAKSSSPKNVGGFWRASLQLDYGFSYTLPRYAEETGELPNRRFVAELSEAFRGPIVEIPRYC